MSGAVRRVVRDLESDAPRPYRIGVATEHEHLRAIAGGRDILAKVAEDIDQTARASMSIRLADSRADRGASASCSPSPCAPKWSVTTSTRRTRDVRLATGSKAVRPAAAADVRTQLDAGQRPHERGEVGRRVVGTVGARDGLGDVQRSRSASRATRRVATRRRRRQRIAVSTPSRSSAPCRFVSVPAAALEDAVRGLRTGEPLIAAKSAVTLGGGYGSMIPLYSASPLGIVNSLLKDAR